MSTSRLKRILGFISLLGVAFTVPSFAHVDDKPPFYKIEYQGRTAYLLGSVHVGLTDFYPMAKQIEQHFEAASALVVEADVTKADIYSLIQQYGQSPQPLDAVTQSMLTQFCQRQTPYCQGIERMSPWLQSMQLSLARFSLLGYLPQFGVDSTLMAKNGDRPIYELESVEFQLALMASFDHQTQSTMIKESIELPDDELHALIAAWRQGDDVKLAQIMAEQSNLDDNNAFIDKLLWQRNVTMAKNIMNLLAQTPSTQSLFIVIGAGHLVGDKSVPENLISHGASITHCWKNVCS